jgi:hypothetical protein
VTSRDNAADRRLGAHWERQFGIMAAQHSRVFTGHQLDKTGAAAAYGLDGDRWDRWLLPDIVIWSAPGEHHEIKHKNPTYSGCYGLEDYRLRSLVKFANTTGQHVYYTIHDWQHAGAANSREDLPNRIEDWFTADITDLSRTRTEHRDGPSYVNGKTEIVPISYWSRARFFRPLSDLWTPTAGTRTTVA